MADHTAALIFFGLMFLVVWIYYKRNPELYKHLDAKTSFGPDKPKKMRSWDGVIYVLWNWKSYAAKTVWLVGIPVIWYIEGGGPAIGWLILGGILILMGKFWELFKR